MRLNFICAILIAASPMAFAEDGHKPPEEHKSEEHKSEEHKSDEHEAVPLGGYESGEVVKSSRDLLVPKAVVKELESWYLKVQHKLNPVTSTGDVEVMGSLQRQLLDLELTLTPKSGKALDRAIQFKLPTGGGEIDLADIVKGRKGGFDVRMKVSKMPENPELRLFYISGARRRKIQDEEYGAGCGKWAEMTSWFNTKMSHEALTVYATDQRHISVLAGTWLFAIVSGPELWLGTLTLTDSRNAHLQCSL